MDNLNTLTDEYLIIGVSAGPDSMALLHKVKKNTSKKIVCAHVNHNVRKESTEEYNYLKSYCQANDIIFESMKITNYTENNFENEARKKRYAFYEKILKKYHSHTLLLAHHGDDLIETVLMKIIRGSNLEGYAGIKEVSKVKDYIIIRPLLNMTKEDIIKYNKDNNIKYFLDNTNNDSAYTRNRIRAKLLPLLKEEDPDIHLKFLKYSNTLQEYYNYIENIANERITNIYKDNKIDITSFKNEAPLIQKNIIFNMLSNIYNNEANIIKDEHIISIIKLIDANKPNIKVDLPNNYQARKAYQYLYLELKKVKKTNWQYPLKNKQTINGITIKKIDNCESNGNNVCRLNSKDIALPLSLRNRRSGDNIALFGTTGHKKIKDIFIEAKISTNERDNYPLLVDANDNILWIPNIKKSKYNVKNGQLYDIILTSYSESEERNEKETK